MDSFAGMEEIRNVNQSLLRGGPKYWEFCSYNPPKTMDNWVNEEALLPDPDRLVHHSTYLDVPKRWLGNEFYLAAEKLKARNELLYKHDYLGEVTGTGGAVFENVEDMLIPDSLIKQFDHVGYGVDFGFSVDPLAFTVSHYDKNHEDLYIFDEIYQVGLKNKKAVRLMMEKCGDNVVIADSAEPRTIAEMRDLGLNIRPARKGPDSIDHGIKWLQGLNHIYIDKIRCPNVYREFVGYEYARDRQGRFISDYPDKDNHCLTGDTLVETVNGSVPIKDLVGKHGKLYAYDEANKKTVIADFDDCRLTRKNAEIYQIELIDGRVINATGDHPVLTKRGWIEVCKLTENDEILDIKVQSVPIKRMKKIGKKDVYNLEVPNYHNFAVNGGLIVHNCIDSIRYRTESLMREPVVMHTTRQSWF